MTMLLTDAVEQADVPTHAELVRRCKALTECVSCGVELADRVLEEGSGCPPGIINRAERFRDSMLLLSEVGCPH